MNTTSTEPKKIKSRFLLTRQNQKGQVAIFVALIFQVIFIFFALLINVGLVVHHKINLQHSVDLAAYYGAMKQAESMNAIAHINFQMRQTWKLFTWRYRVLGTFGFIKTSVGANPLTQIDFPFESNAGQFRYNGSFGQFGMTAADAYKNGNVSTNPSISSPAQNCEFNAQSNPDYRVDGAAVGPHDIPFFCAGHAGFSEWPSGESNCQIQCGVFSNPQIIAKLPGLATAMNTPFGNNTAASTNAVLTQVNRSLADRCNALSKFGAVFMARFMVAYATESRLRAETIKMLASNLSQTAEEFVDLDGKKIIDGTKRTLENNLTGANFTGLDQSSFQTYNGLSDQKCSFKGGQDPANTEFLKNIDFRFLNLFIHACTTSGGGFDYEPETVYKEIDPFLGDAVMLAAPQSAQDIMKSLLVEGQRFTVGYEKNPNCVEYYAVKASSEPTIPFLPLSKIRLDAVAVAKPFGGSIGPSFGKTWPKGSPRSNFTDGDPNSRVDKTLPLRDFPSAPKIKESVYMQPNFSLFVGDRLGLRNLDYLAANHSMLAIRDLPGAYSNLNTSSPLAIANNNGAPGGPGPWPSFINWTGLDAAVSDFRQYDSLASSSPQSLGLRAVEISAIVPNQFDIAYYSIDPDFYNNYYTKIYNNFNEIKNASGYSGFLRQDMVRPDFGAKDVDAGSNQSSTPLNEKTFSVKDQILMKNAALDTVPRFRGTAVPATPVRGTTGTKYSELLNFLVSAQSSLLSGWTFKQYNNYGIFPEGPVNMTDNTMAFGQCLDDWNNTQNAVTNPTDPANFRTPGEASNGKPPVPGNCVTGGRTGYSVKIVSPSRVLQSNQNIENPIDQNFFNF
jgi:hypothetical protein